MLQMIISDSVYLNLLEKRHSSDLFACVEGDREHLEKWIPFVSKTHSIQDAEAYINKALEGYKNGEGYLYGIWDKKELIGIVLAKDIDNKAKVAEIGYMIKGEYEGKGIIKESCKKLMSFLFSELNMQKIIICCDARNERSIGLAKKMGFILEGTHKRQFIVNDELCDLMYWAKFVDEYKEE